jgi:hypothetical protein
MSDETESVKEPKTPDELRATHKILRSDPQRYLRIVNEWIRENPANLHAYFARHHAWLHLGDSVLAPQDTILSANCNFVNGSCNRPSGDQTGE